MAASAVAVLPLATVRQQLRIESDADDAALTGMINSAVAWVGRTVGRQIIDGTRLVRLGYPGDRSPLRIRGRDLAEPTSVSYYAPGDDLTLAPTRTVTPGRWLAGIDGAGSISELWPPAGGWPAVEANSRVEVTLSFGMAPADIPPPWIQAAILLVREAYEGSGLDAIPEDSAIYRLLRPYLTWAA